MEHSHRNGLKMKYWAGDSTIEENVWKKAKMLYLECNAGISGDMTVAALLDLGADETKLRAVLKSLPVSGYDVLIHRVSKSGIDCCSFDVLLDASCENHDHDMEYLHGHNHMHSHTGAGNAHDHAHMHGHSHRGLPEITKIIEAGEMSDGARAMALKIFQILADAEAKAHGVPADQVHFHEVGAVDSIVDIVAAAVCLDDLGVEQVVIPKLCEGHGTVRCQHGVLPVPVPAVLNILQAYEISAEIIDIQGEFITPTGAAIAAAFRTVDCLPKEFIIRKTGMGAGKREYERPSILRAMLLEETSKKTSDIEIQKTGNLNTKYWNEPNNRSVNITEQNSIKLPKENFYGEIDKNADCAIIGNKDYVKSHVSSEQNKIHGTEQTSEEIYEKKAAYLHDTILKLETNIDDCTGEMLGYVMELLLQAGAKDVRYTPVYMKKNRPAWQLDVLCDPKQAEELEAIIFRETTTIGIRHQLMDRTILPREQIIVQTKFGTAEAKVCIIGDEIRCYPEYDSVKAVCEKTGVSYQEVYRNVMQAGKDVMKQRGAAEYHGVLEKNV